MCRSGAYTSLGGGDSTDFAAFPDTVPAQEEEEFADFNSAFAQTGSSGGSIPAVAVAAAPVVAAPAVDLFADFDSAPAPTGAKAAATANEGLDLFGLLPTAPTTPSLQFPSVSGRYRVPTGSILKQISLKIEIFRE